MFLEMLSTFCVLPSLLLFYENFRCPIYIVAESSKTFKVLYTVEYTYVNLILAKSALYWETRLLNITAYFLIRQSRFFIWGIEPTVAKVSTFLEFVIFKENEFKFVSVSHMVLTIVGGLNMERLMVLSTSFFSGFLCIGNCQFWPHPRWGYTWHRRTQNSLRSLGEKIRTNFCSCRPSGWISWLFVRPIRSSLHTANEGPVSIEYKCLVPIYVFPDMKLCSLLISKTVMFCLPIHTRICLWEIYIFPRSVCLFCCSQICGQILDSHTHQCGNWDEAA
jgi:hypothetical protein